MRNEYYKRVNEYLLCVRPNVANAYTDIIGERVCTRAEIDREIRELTDSNLSYTFFAVTSYGRLPNKKDVI